MERVAPCVYRTGGGQYQAVYKHQYLGTYNRLRDATEVVAKAGREKPHQLGGVAAHAKRLGVLGKVFADRAPEELRQLVSCRQRHPDFAANGGPLYVIFIKGREGHFRAAVSQKFQELAPEARLRLALATSMVPEEAERAARLVYDVVWAAARACATKDRAYWRESASRGCGWLPLGKALYVFQPKAPKKSKKSQKSKTSQKPKVPKKSKVRRAEQMEASQTPRAPRTPRKSQAPPKSEEFAIGTRRYERMPFDPVRCTRAVRKYAALGAALQSGPIPTGLEEYPASVSAWLRAAGLPATYGPLKLVRDYWTAEFAARRRVPVVPGVPLRLADLSFLTCGAGAPVSALAAFPDELHWVQRFARHFDVGTAAALCRKLRWPWPIEWLTAWACLFHAPSAMAITANERQWEEALAEEQAMWRGLEPSVTQVAHRVRVVSAARRAP